MYSLVTAPAFRGNGLLERMDFGFDAVLPPSSSQEDVYNAVAKPVVQVCSDFALILPWPLDVWLSCSVVSDLTWFARLAGCHERIQWHNNGIRPDRCWQDVYFVKPVAY